MNLKDLKKQIPFQWKVQSYNKEQTKGSCVAYIDARDVMDLLDEVCGIENWQKKFYVVKNTLCCSIGIKIGDEWIWKDDGGVESSTEKEKGECSDSFKRAGVNWGIGRFLYDKEIRWINIQNKKPVDNQGNIIWDLTKYFNELDTKITSPSPSKQTNNDEVVVEPVNQEPLVCNVCGEKLVWKTGTTKAGKQYQGYFCPNSSKDDKNHSVTNFKYL